MCYLIFSIKYLIVIDSEPYLALFLQMIIKIDKRIYVNKSYNFKVYQMYWIIIQILSLIIAIVILRYK